MAMLTFCLCRVCAGAKAAVKQGFIGGKPGVADDAGIYLPEVSLEIFLKAFYFP